jgi:C4-type Zn-finger protein
MNKLDDQEESNLAGDCPNCGMENSVFETPDHEMVINDEKLRVKAFICEACGFESFDKETFLKILNLREGNSYTHFRISSDGVIERVVTH